MAAQSEALEKICRYANDVQKTDAVTEDSHGSTSGATQAAHEARLSKTITELQNLVQEQQVALEKVIDLRPYSLRLHQAKVAYSSEPLLQTQHQPSHHRSPLCAFTNCE